MLTNVSELYKRIYDSWFESSIETIGSTEHLVFFFVFSPMLLHWSFCWSAISQPQINLLAEWSLAQTADVVGHLAEWRCLKLGILAG